MRTSHKHLDRNAKRNGLTLLELMVVLVILAILATVAVQSLQPRVESERFQSSANLLEQVKQSVLGPVKKYQVDGTPLVSGFVADIGRLPLAENGNSTGPFSRGSREPGDAGFTELWSDQTELAAQFPFQFRAGPETPTDYSKIELPCGWRGPYLQLPIGATTLKDSWGRPLQPVFDDQGRVGGLRIEIPGSDTGNGPQLLDTDLTGGKVQVTGKVLVDRPEESSIRVVLLTPSPDSSLTHLHVMDDENSQADSFEFDDVAVGLRAVVADVDGQRHVKYVQVPHEGINVIFDLKSRDN